MVVSWFVRLTLLSFLSFLFRLINDCFECSGLIHSEVSEGFAVDNDTCFLEATHQLAVAQTFEASGSVDTLDLRPSRRAAALIR